MRTDRTVPSNREVIQAIKENSPKNSKCVDSDLLKMQGFCLVAWVIEQAISENQGLYMALASQYSNGKFHNLLRTIPCRYYIENGKKKITTAPFGYFPSGDKASLLEKTGENGVNVNLVCSGKMISQIHIHGEKEHRLV